MSLQARIDLALFLCSGAAATSCELVIETLEGLLACHFVNTGDDVLREVEDLLQVARRDLEQRREAARRPLEVPNMRDRARKLDVAHALAADLGSCDLNATLVADDPLIADALVLSAVALPVARWPEDALVEEAVLLWLQRAVVDRLRLGDLALRPATDLLRAR